MLPVTAQFTAIMAIWLVMLSINVIVWRYRAKADLGLGTGAPMLERAVRVHGNFTEYTPFVLIILALLEYSAASPDWLYGLGITYFAGRVLHAFTLLIAENKPWGWVGNMPYFRTLAMVLTFTVLLLGAYQLYIRLAESS